MSLASCWSRPDRTRSRVKKGQQAQKRLPPSSRLAIIRNEGDKDHVAVLSRLLKTLEENEVPGPQLFRLHKEFSKPLGEGSEGNVRCINIEGAAQYHKLDKRIRSKWPFELIAIKQHRKLRDGRQTRARRAVSAEPDRNNLAARFVAAECEVLALSPSLFRNHPNIVQLKGWGLCLDTIEDGECPCCGPLQVPLLVLERAEMNLSQFLRQHFSEPAEYRNLDLEQGIPNSLSVPSNYSRPSRYDPGMTTWDSLASWITVGEDRYEGVRQLCIDIGHGLEALHQNKFTHGDLKPENILMFRNGTNWTAKLCDFGCARGEINAPASGRQPQKQREPYHGTEGWLPPAHEADADHDFDGLRRCDIYVYGLVVWSCFYLEGEPPENPSLARAKSTGKRFQDRWKWFSPKRRRLNESINRVFECTLCPNKSERGPAPWRELQRGQQTITRAKNDPRGQSTTSRREEDSQVLPSSHQDSGNTRRYDLLPEQKMAYRRRRWWIRTCAAVENELNRTQEGIDDTSDSKFAKDLEEDPSNGANMEEDETATRVTSTVRHPDDDLFCNQPFETAIRREESQSLHRELLDVLGRLPAEHSFVDLYCLARFRSRIPLAWWQESGAHTNMVEIALRFTPEIDICTLSWLCKGPIGNFEVASLFPHFFARILSSKFRGHALDESARLDRFLLLFRSGARIEKEFSVSRWRSGCEPLSVLAWFLSECRPATHPVVIKEIYRRVYQAQTTEYMAASTLDYIRSPVGDSSPEQWSRLQRDLSLVGKNLPRVWAQIMNASPISPDTTTRAVENTPLLPSPSLPPGWKRHGDCRGNDNQQCFEDKYTHSFTLEQPRVSLMEIRQLKIGFLDPKIGGSCYLDLAHYITPGMSLGSSKTFDMNITNRFPIYDDVWFSEEWRTVPPRDDVLRKVKEITPFSTRISNLRFRDALTNSIRWSLRALVRAMTWLHLLGVLILCLGMLVVIHGLVFAVVLGKMEFPPGLIWVTVPVFLLFALAYLLIIVSLIHYYCAEDGYVGALGFYSLSTFVHDMIEAYSVVIGLSS
ncbi:hypothetical protein B0T10DRAFT_603954 [Thelonectria olida]|uniref:Protein kinase domain-containing protein n=1 Tax=Thelonectria olida TaxID=1576542 RepID=A0A9P8WBG0_9HYPO|nr:hypothetical protein B0T10DRAFT_603954 [Thelonectria olida]